MEHETLIKHYSESESDGNPRITIIAELLHCPWQIPITFDFVMWIMHASEENVVVSKYW